MFGQHRAAIGYKFVTVHSSMPVNCLNRIYDGLQRYNNELGINFKLYYNGTSPDYPNVGMGQPWRESSIDILFSDIAGYTYKGTTLYNGHLGFADNAYSSTDRTHISRRASMRTPTTTISAAAPRGAAISIATERMG